MENNMDYKTPGSFEDYMEQIKEIIKNNRKERNELGRSIREINFHEHEVDANFEYFRECYDSNETPEYVVSNLKYNDEELFRKLEDITDEYILSEVNSRYLTNMVISDADTDDLEDEVDDRWDKTMVRKQHLSVEELLEILADKGKYTDINNPKEVICELLGFYNSFSVTFEEAVNELKKFF